MTGAGLLACVGSRRKGARPGSRAAVQEDTPPPLRRLEMIQREGKGAGTLGNVVERGRWRKRLEFPLLSNLSHAGLYLAHPAGS